MGREREEKSLNLEEATRKAPVRGRQAEEQRVTACRVFYGRRWGLAPASWHFLREKINLELPCFHFQ